MWPGTTRRSRSEESAPDVRGVAATTAATTGGRRFCVAASRPGPLSRDHREVKFAPNIYGFDNVPVVDYLSDALGIKVVLENDAKAAARAW